MTAEPLIGLIPPHIELAGDYIIRVTAISPATGATVSGVVASDVVITALDVATGETIKVTVVEPATPPSSLPPPPPVTSPGVTVTYTVSGTTITLHWTAVSGAVGYEFLVDGKRVSNTWDGSRSSAQFSIPDAGTHTYEVVALSVLDDGKVTYPAVAPPPPPPSPTPTGALFDGFAGSGIVPPWTAIQAKPGRITRTAGVLQFVCEPGDNNIAGSESGERAEVYKGGIAGYGKEGTDQWTALRLWFANGYPYFGANQLWNYCAQWHASVGGTQPCGLSVYNGHLQCVTNGGANTTDKPFHNAPVASFKTGHEFSIRVHHHWSSTSAGFFAVSVDGAPEVKVSGPNLYAGDSGPYPKLGVYRAPGLGEAKFECRGYAVFATQAEANSYLGV